MTLHGVQLLCEQRILKTKVQPEGMFLPSCESLKCSAISPAC